MAATEDPRETDLHPRRRTSLIGHEATEQQLLRAYQGGRMHHAWLLAGQRGIGKATLAYRLARFILAHPDPGKIQERSTLQVLPEAGAARRIVSRGHPDLLVLERQFDQKRERLKTEIVIEDAREASVFFTRTAGEGGWRICIVDSADDLNSASANALLKILEEPPARCLFLLISHRPGALLSTIRSRSPRIDLRPLSDEQTFGVIKDVYGEEEEDAALRRAAVLSAGSPGRALELLANKGAEIFNSVRGTISERGGMQPAEQFKLADRFSGRDSADDFDIFCELLLDWTAGEARRFAGAPKGAALAGAHGEIAHSIRLTNALNLDRRQAILDAMSRLEEAMKGRLTVQPKQRTMSAPKFYITTAIPYANGAPHIGHAYERIATDVIARFKRLDGNDVLFVTGMDEHGQKMQQTAAREVITPQQLADRVAGLFEEMGTQLDSPADDIVRTTSPRHKDSVQEIWQRMAANGDIYLSKYSGWYSVRDEAYYDADETEEREGRRFSLKTGTPVEWVEEESYFFKLSAYAKPLLDHYERNPDFVTPEKYRNEIVAFVKRGLNDLSISRTTFDWGIPVPGDPKHVMYVWVDALTNYITATGFPDANAPRATFWPANAHVIGKDITRFHAIYWPAFLMSAKLPLPKQIVVHGFLFNRGEKMSKSVGNVISPESLVREYGVDQLRYFFMREVPFGQDGNYSHEAIISRINADLANDLGNLAQRSLSMIAKNCDGRVPTCGALSADDKILLDATAALLGECRAMHEVYAINRALDAIWKVVADANRYFAAQAPWALKKTDPARMETVLYVTAEVLRQVGILIQPYMPASGGRLLDLLSVPPEVRMFGSLEDGLVSGTQLPAPSPVFPRYVEKEEEPA